MNSETAVRVEHLSKSFRIPHENRDTLRERLFSLGRKMTYETFTALQDVSFDIRKGEFVGIIGRNGSGKSTLLKILAGIYTPDSGSVQVNGEISPFLELGVGFNPELSGRDNIFLNGTILGLRKSEIRKKFDEIVAFSELERFIDQKLKNYSSGMQVRLAFSVAIHANKGILLMDEVLAVGDMNFQVKCITEFNRYKQSGNTVILVTHDIGMVQRYCDRAILLRNGVIRKTGKADDVVNEYIGQNMQDEEERKPRKTVAEARVTEPSGSPVPSTGDEHPAAENQQDDRKDVTIENVIFLSSAGEARHIFKTGEDIVVRILYRALHKVEKPVFGIAIHTQDGIHLIGPNTRSSHYEIEAVEGDGFVDFQIRNNPFFTGTFLVSASAYAWECVTPFDFKDRRYEFRIMSSEENQNGLLKMEFNWRHQATEI